MKTLAILNYKVRYKELSATQIFNFLGPWANLHHLPYGQRHKEALAVIERRNAKDDFFNRLEQDIIENGVKDPVVIHSGWFPQSLWERFPNEVKVRDMKKIDACIDIGGSRLWFANKHKLKVPCLINDFTGKHDNGKLISSVNEVKELFDSVPSSISFKETGLSVVAEKGTEWEFNPH